MTAWWIADPTTADSQRQRLLDDYAAHVADDISAPLRALRASILTNGGDRDLVRDPDGTAYLDLRCGAGVAALGHRPRAAVDALRDALRTMDIGDQQLPSQLRADLAADLSTTVGEGRWRWQFCGGGSEAAEFALRTAMAATGRDRVVALHGGYHGQAGLAAAVTDPRHLPGPYPRLAVEPIRITPNDDVALALIDDRVAAVIAEPVQLSGRICLLSAEWLRALRLRCDTTGTILVLDETKSGLNRCGPLWAHENSGIVPDILLVGKALSAGLYPVAAYGLRDEGVLRDWRSPLRSSYGGSLLGMAVGRAALAQLTDPDNQRCYQRTAEAFALRLRHHLGHPDDSGRQLRRHGAAFELALPNPETALFVAADLLHRRVLVPMPTASALILLPALTVSDDTADLACARIAAAVRAAAAALPSGEDATIC
ncbi:acetylornithine/LysW-gamma-L-lysine aminotransferase [Micromonospora violae]|uniref:Acetylornithine/LysW-gamma-L-lysine aminotransferase n=1 Tax=Micromonospora violae TaxID=1278207 RepID=A0A4Q7UAQ2_9ACTN|nr:aminotransferase class III-fold pyridoxal phosphate-dependent enzyme [Micromonospora violae]RZT78076.1 acetylornithine/LysW-gamma-L-lysine aminotransferase [Micromonospora violae]